MKDINASKPRKQMEKMGVKKAKESVIPLQPQYEPDLDPDRSLLGKVRTLKYFSEQIHDLDGSLRIEHP